MLLSEALMLYLARPHLAENTRASYRNHIRQFMLRIGDKPIAEIKQADLMHFIAWKQGQGRTNRTLNQISTILKGFFGWLQNNDYLPGNPAKKLERLKESPIPDKQRAISRNEWERLSTYAKRVSVRDFAILAFLLDSACRVSAAASLRLENLYLDSLKAVVYESKIQRWVDVAFSDATAYALECWLRERPSVAHSFVFTIDSMPHSPILAASIRTMMRRHSTKLGMRIITPHKLRHAALQHLAKQPDVTLLDVQTKANHLSARTTLQNYFPQKSERVFELSQKYSLVEQPRQQQIPNLRVLKKG